MKVTHVVDGQDEVDQKWLDSLAPAQLMSWAGFKHTLMKHLGVDDRLFNDWDVPQSWQQAYKARVRKVFKDSDPEDPSTWKIDPIREDGKVLYNVVDPTGHILEGFDRRVDADAWLKRAKKNFRTRDAKWTVTYSAKTKEGKKVEFTATVEANDNYDANDKVKALAEQKYGSDLYYPVIRVKGGPKRLEAGSVSQRVAATAGAEED